MEKNSIDKIVMSFLIAIYRGICLVIGPGHSRGIIKRFFEVIEKDEYFTCHARPQKAARVSTVNDGLKRQAELSVILQGPVMTENDFTLETLKLYQKHFEGHSLILSTWEGEDEAVITAAEKMGVHCLMNKKPDYFGISNINLQIASSKAGVRKAAELGSKYVLKTRTDQRMYAPNIAEYLYNVTEAFPVTGEYPKQKKRIVGVSLNTFKYRMYGLSDMTIYGHIDDMLLYWGVKEDARVFADRQREEARKSAFSFAELAVCEVYLTTEFLKAIDREILWTLQDSWQVFADNFCVVDKEQLDVFWPKYNRQEYRYLTYQQDYRTQEMGFREWFNIYSGLGNKNIDSALTPEYLHTI